MAKKKSSNRGQKKLIGMLIMLVISGVCLFNTFKEINTTRELNSEIKENSKELVQLKDDKKMLEKNKSNLENDDYLIRYARGKYMVTSGDEEQVFKLDN